LMTFSQEHIQMLHDDDDARLNGHD